MKSDVKVLFFSLFAKIFSEFLFDIQTCMMRFSPTRSLSLSHSKACEAISFTYRLGNCSMATTMTTTTGIEAKGKRYPKNQEHIN